VLNSLAMTGVWITGGSGKLLWKKALATAVLAVSTVLIVNLVDPAHQIYSWEWFRHLLIAAAATTAVMEAKYWRDWANKVLGTSNENGESE
jgi:hypothetical protein